MVSSFSSFPSFPSLPDNAPGPSTPAQKDEISSDKRHHKKEKKRRKNEQEDEDTDGKKKRHKHSDKLKKRDHSEGERRHRTSKSPSQSHPRDYQYGGIDDERKKQEEDCRSRDTMGIDKPSTIEGLVYFTDRKGDPLNVQYGGLHAGDIPKYRLVGGGRKVLGLSPILAVVHRGRAGIEVAPHGRRRMAALTDSKSRRILLDAPKRRIVATEDKYKFREVDGFLRIRSNRPRPDDQSYREVEFTTQQEAESDDSALGLSDSSGSSDDDSDTAPMTSSRYKLNSLEDKVASNPQDITSWCSILSHTLATVPTSSKNASKARAELSISVLEKAMSAHPDNGRSRALLLKYMQAGEELWDNSKLREEWNRIVKVDDVEVWMAWFDWTVHNMFGIVDSIIDEATRVTKALSTRGDEVGQLRLFWRTAVALRDAGYGERAHALFQAQAELLFSIPQRLSTKPFEDQLNDLEEFWDSEVPRLGEPGAKGWKTWEGPDAAEAPRPRASTPTAVVPPISDPYSRWAASESLADRTQGLPHRTADDDDSDPYSVVLFFDIRPLLLPLRSQRARDLFRYIWLAFTGLHVPGFLASLSEHSEDNTDDRWAYSHLASPPYLAAIFPSEISAGRITADAHAGVLVGREREYGSGFGPVKNWGIGVIPPFESLGTSKWMMWTGEDVQATDASLVREIFRQCNVSGDDPDWDVLKLAFEAAVGLKSAAKVSKSLLAGARDSLPHWGTHARLECLRGRYDDARKVYHTVLVATSRNRTGEAALWWDWAHMEWLSRNNDVALQVIIRSSGVPGSGNIATLRAKRHFESLLAEQSHPSWREFEPWIKIAALLELLTSSPQSTVALLDGQLDALQPRSSAHESLMVASLALLYDHVVVLRSPTPPALLRERAEGAIELYPNNTAILGIFLEAEKGQGIWGRVRALLGETAADNTRKEKSVARRVAEVWVAGWEKGRWEAEVERVRNGLAAAVEDERTRGSAILWKLYIAFEMRAGQSERAKKLVLRAISECPLVKELYLLAFGPLRAVFSAHELVRLGDTMAERGVRMRVGLDEVVERADNRAEADEGGEGEGDEDEIEYNARELRRLRPY